MQVISRMESAQQLTTVSGMMDESLAEGKVAIGRWITVLGIIRVASTSAVWVAASLNEHSGPISSSEVSAIGASLIGNPPLVPLAMLWLVALGILVSRSCWPEWIGLASVTFFLLSIAGALKALGDWSLASDSTVTIGSFTLNRSELALPTPRALALALFGGTQLLAEFVVAVRAAWVLKTSHHSVEAGAIERKAFSPDLSPRTKSVLIRACWLLSLGFLILVVRLPVLPRLNDLISSAPLLRELLLMNDKPGRLRRGGTRPIDAESVARERKVQVLLTQAMRSWGNQNYEEAERAFEQALEIYPSADKLQDPQTRVNLALVQNNYAWLLVTRPNPGPEDSRKAVEQAQHAVTQSPYDGNYWNTLAVAQYRTKNWQAAKDALLRSMELRGDGDGFDWILFSLVYAQTGRKERALEWYGKAARWRQDYRPWDQELYAFDVEAASLLGLPDPQKPSGYRPFRQRDEGEQTMYRGRGLPPQLAEPRKSHRGGR